MVSFKFRTQHMIWNLSRNSKCVRTIHFIIFMVYFEVRYIYILLTICPSVLWYDPQPWYLLPSCILGKYSTKPCIDAFSCWVINSYYTCRLYLATTLMLSLPPVRMTESVSAIEQAYLHKSYELELENIRCFVPGGMIQREVVASGPEATHSPHEHQALATLPAIMTISQDSIPIRRTIYPNTTGLLNWIRLWLSQIIIGPS